MLANKVCGCSNVFISRLMGSAIDTTGYSWHNHLNPTQHVIYLLSPGPGRECPYWPVPDDYGNLLSNRVSILLMTCRPCLNIKFSHFMQLQTHAHLSPVREEEEEEEMITEPTAADPSRASEQK